MKYSWCKVLLMLTLVVLSTLVAFAGNGKITGVVKDAASGEPVVGANVVIEGTTLGAAADEKGVYYILNVPPGTYNVIVSSVGYARAITRNVRVSSDQIVTLNVSLRSEAVGLQEVVIVAEQPLVDRSRIATKTTFASDEMSNMPVGTVFDVINTGASSYNGFVRGGRYVETKTIVDGVDVSDPYSAVDADSRGIEGINYGYLGVVRQYGKQNVQAGVSMASVEEASLNTGAVGAEYTSATAGLINLTLKEGRGPLGGSVFIRTSPGGLKHAGPAVYLDQNKYFAERDASTKKPKYTWTTGKLGTDIYSYDQGNQSSMQPTTDAEVTLNGSVTNDLGVFFSGRLYNSYGTMPGEFFREIDLSLKATYQVTSSMKIAALAMVRDRGKLFGWRNRSFNDNYRYLLEGVPMNDGTSMIGSLKWTHFLSANTFYEVQISRVDNNDRLGYVDGNGDGIIDFNESGDFLTFGTQAEYTKYADKFFSSGPKNGPDLTGFGSPPYQLSGPGLFYENTTVATNTLRGDIASQITYNHQLKAGGQIRFHDISNLKRSSPVGFVEENYEVKPEEYGFYLQDRIEYAGLVVNVGARVDGLNYNQGDFGSFFAPAVKDPSPTFGIARAIAARGDVLKTKWYFTPKIGVSHPIEDVGAVYFSFSRQMTPPPFGNVFAAYNLYGTSPILPGASQIDQNPFISTNYELGAQWVFLRDFSLDVNAYFRNIENYGIDGATVVWRSPAGIPNLYALQFSGGYADARGVELTITKRPSRLLDFVDVSGRISYAYSYVKASSGPIGTSANVNDVTQFSTAAGDSVKFGGTIPFSSYPFYNRIQQDVVGVNSTLTGGYDRTHRITASIFLRADYDIHVSLLGKFASGFFYSKAFAEPRSRELGTSPWVKQIDARVEKGFTFGKTRAAAFVEVKNLLDSENILTYFASPDGKGQELWEKQGDPTGPDKRATTADGSHIYDIARQIYLGISINF